MEERAEDKRVYDLLPGHPDFQFVGPLSKGAFGLVCHYVHVPSNCPVAIKFIPRAELIARYVEFEVLNHRLMRHPHIIRFKSVFYTDKHVCIVMEYANGGNLLRIVDEKRRLPEHEARWYFQQVCACI